MLDYQPLDAKNSSWDQEGEEEERIWAEDQIRKGMATSVLRFPQTEFGRVNRKNKTLEPTPRPVSASSLKEHHLSVMQASEHALSSLRQAVARLRHSESQATKNLSKTKEKLLNSKAMVDQIQTQLTVAGDKYVFLQKLRTYVANLCAMLSEKTPIIETLEEESESIKKERALVHYYKSVDCFHEDLDPIEAGITAVSTLLNDHANAASAKETEAAFIRALEERKTQIASGKHIPVNLDEFGRDENSNRRLESARRRKRRAAQREVMAAKFYSSFENSKDIAIGSAYVEPELGGETTSESEAEEDSFLQRNGEILGAAGLVFRDVAEEYASLEAVCSNLDNLKTNYPAEYERAYMTLSMPVLISPFVRLGLLEWSPLHSHQSTVHTISDLNWYRILSTYGINSGKTTKSADSDSCDENNCEGKGVISKLVQALVLPQASFLIRHCWNPYSIADSLAIASILTEISKHVSQDSEDWRNIVTEVKIQLERSISRLKVPAWSEMTLEACGRNKYQALYQSARCFGRALRVLKSLCAFRDVLPHSIVHELAINKLVIELLVPYTMSSPHHGVQSQRIERIVAALPPKWVMGEGGVQNCGLEGALCSLQEAAKLLLQEPGEPEHVNKASHVASALEKLGDGSLALQLRLEFGG
jgi:GC-rich sequence DNA-binding factor